MQTNVLANTHIRTVLGNAPHIHIYVSCCVPISILCNLPEHNPKPECEKRAPQSLGISVTKSLLHRLLRFRGMLLEYWFTYRLHINFSFGLHYGVATETCKRVVFKASIVLLAKIYPWSLAFHQWLTSFMTLCKQANRTCAALVWTQFWNWIPISNFGMHFTNFRFVRCNFKIAQISIMGWSYTYIHTVLRNEPCICVCTYIECTQQHTLYLCIHSWLSAYLSWRTSSSRLRSAPSRLCSVNLCDTADQYTQCNGDRSVIQDKNLKIILSITKCWISLIEDTHLEPPTNFGQRSKWTGVWWIAELDMLPLMCGPQIKYRSFCRSKGCLLEVLSVWLDPKSGWKH